MQTNWRKLNKELALLSEAQVLELLDEIRQRLNLAVLFITHDLRVAAQICDYVAVMSKGRVVEDGAAEQGVGALRDDDTKALGAAAPGRAGHHHRAAGRRLDAVDLFQIVAQFLGLF